MASWDTELKLGAALAESLLHSQFPGLKFGKISFLDEGWDSAVYETDTGILFKFPKRQNAVPALLREQQLLARDNGIDAIPIPKIQWQGQASDAFPAPFFGYKKLGGKFLTEIPGLPTHWQDLAAQAGRFLDQLRKVAPPADWEPHPLVSVRQDQVARFPEVLNGVKPLLQACEATALDLALGHFKILDPSAYAPGFAHADLTAVHILHDESSGLFSGVIDWADMELINPLADFVGFYAWGGEAFFRAMLETYHGPVGAEALPWLKQRTLVMGLFETYNSLETGNLKDRKAGLLALKCALEP